MAEVSVSKKTPGREPARRETHGWLTRPSEFYPSWFWRDLSPFAMMRRFMHEMDRAFSGFGATAPEEAAPWMPAVEVKERDGDMVVAAELPGLTKEDVKVEISDEGLTIQGERKREHEEKGEGFYRSERSYGHFYRTIPLPEGADVEKAKAQFNNGVLEVSIPIPEGQRRKAREIPIGAGETQKSGAR